MANKLAFEIETDSSYTSAEKQELLDAFLDFMNEVDGNVIEGTEDVTITDSDISSDSDSEEKIVAKAKELIKSGHLTVRIKLETDDDELFDTDDALIPAVG